MLAGGQRAPKISLGRVKLHLGVPGKPDTAFGAQHGDPVQDSPWEGSHNLTPQDHRLQGFRTHLNAHQEAGGQVLGGQTLRVQPRHQGVPYLQRKNNEGGEEQEHRVRRDAIEASVTTDQRTGQHQRGGQHRHPQFSRCTRGPRHAARRTRLHIAYRLHNDVTYDHTIPIVAVVVFVLTLTHRCNAVRGHRTGSDNSGAEDYPRRKTKKKRR